MEQQSRPPRPSVVSKDTNDELSIFYTTGKEESRHYTVMHSGNQVSVNGIIYSARSEYFLIEEVDDNGNSSIFNQHVMYWARLSDAVLQTILPQVLFIVNSPKALRLLLRYVWQEAELRLGKTLKMQIELCLVNGLLETQPSFRKWKLLDCGHGVVEGAYDHFKEWFDLLHSVPPRVTLFLYFAVAWRDYRYLRKLAHLSPPYTNIGGFRFGLVRFTGELVNLYNGQQPDDEWHRRQTMASVMDLNIPEMYNQPHQLKVGLRAVGCRGFAGRGSPLHLVPRVQG